MHYMNPIITEVQETIAPAQHPVSLEHYTGSGSQFIQLNDPLLNEAWKCSHIKVPVYMISRTDERARMDPSFNIHDLYESIDCNGFYVLVIDDRRLMEILMERDFTSSRRKMRDFVYAMMQGNTLHNAWRSSEFHASIPRKLGLRHHFTAQEALAIAMGGLLQKGLSEIDSRELDDSSKKSQHRGFVDSLKSQSQHLFILNW